MNKYIKNSKDILLSIDNQFGNKLLYKRRVKMIAHTYQVMPDSKELDTSKIIITTKDNVEAYEHCPKLIICNDVTGIIRQVIAVDNNDELGFTPLIEDYILELHNNNIGIFLLFFCPSYLSHARSPNLPPTLTSTFLPPSPYPPFPCLFLCIHLPLPFPLLPCISLLPSFTPCISLLPSFIPLPLLPSNLFLRFLLHTLLCIPFLFLPSPFLLFLPSYLRGPSLYSSSTSFHSIHTSFSFPLSHFPTNHLVQSLCSLLLVRPLFHHLSFHLARL